VRCLPPLMLLSLSLPTTMLFFALITILSFWSYPRLCHRIWFIVSSGFGLWPIYHFTWRDDFIFKLKGSILRAKLKCSTYGIGVVEVEAVSGLADNVGALLECVDHLKSNPRARIRVIWSRTQFCCAILDEAAMRSIAQKTGLLSFIYRDTTTELIGGCLNVYPHRAQFTYGFGTTFSLTGYGELSGTALNSITRAQIAPLRREILQLFRIDSHPSRHGAIHLRWGDFATQSPYAWSPQEVAYLFSKPVHELISSHPDVPRWHMVFADDDFGSELRKHLQELGSAKLCVWPNGPTTRFGQLYPDWEPTRVDLGLLATSQVLGITIGRFGAFAGALSTGEVHLIHALGS